MLNVIIIIFRFLFLFKNQYYPESCWSLRDVFQQFNKSLFDCSCVALAPSLKDHGVQYEED